MAALGRRPRPTSSRYARIFPMAKAGNFPWRFPGSPCGEFREFRLTENTSAAKPEEPRDFKRRAWAVLVRRSINSLSSLTYLRAERPEGEARRSNFNTI